MLKACLEDLLRVGSLAGQGLVWLVFTFWETVLQLVASVLFLIT